ncbi:MAG: hypothetical protein IKU34_11200 [Clostridia bacterium]|nr:hypothetical protein [Clostridia bacterium]
MITNEAGKNVSSAGFAVGHRGQTLRWMRRCRFLNAVLRRRDSNLAITVFLEKETIFYFIGDCVKIRAESTVKNKLVKSFESMSGYWVLVVKS